MEDKFEEYIRKNRAEIDADKPNEEYLWDGIQVEMVRKTYRKKLRIWRIAATVLALVTLGQWSFSLYNTSTKSNSQDIIVVDVPAEKGSFETLEATYQREVDDLQSQVNSKQVNPSEYTVLYDELSYIEELEDEFRSDIPVVNDRERLAEILVDTYEKKIRLLERLLEQIERDEKRKQQFQEL